MARYLLLVLAVVDSFALATPVGPRKTWLKTYVIVSQNRGYAVVLILGNPLKVRLLFGNPYVQFH